MKQIYLIEFKGKEVQKMGDLSKDLAEDLKLDWLPVETVMNIKRVEKV